MPRFTDADALRGYLDLKPAAQSEVTDGTLEARLDAGEAAAERYARRRFAPADTDPTETKMFTTRRKQLVRVPDLRSIPVDGFVALNGVNLSNDEWDPGDFWTEQPTTMVELVVSSQLTQDHFVRVPLVGQPYIRNDLQIRGKWGFSPTPADVIEAVYLMVSRVWKRRAAGYSDQQVTPEGEVRSYLRTMPDEAKASLDSYRKHLVGVI